jgi:hypothetical protein
MKIRVYYRQNLTQPYSMAVVHVPENVVNKKNWLKNHLKGLGIQANYLIYEEM